MPELAPLPAGVDVAQLQAGDVVTRARLTITRDDVLRYAAASGDDNPIHQSDEAARALGLPGVVAHGMLTMGRALSVVTGWVGDPARIRSYSTRFVRPVVVAADGGAVVDVQVGVVEAVEAVVTLSLEVSSAGEKVLGRARVEADLG